MLDFNVTLFNIESLASIHDSKKREKIERELFDALKALVRDFLSRCEVIIENGKCDENYDVCIGRLVFRNNDATDVDAQCWNSTLLQIMFPYVMHKVSSDYKLTPNMRDILFDAMMGMHPNPFSVVNQLYDAHELGDTLIIGQDRKILETAALDEKYVLAVINPGDITKCIEEIDAGDWDDYLKKTILELG